MDAIHIERLCKTFNNGRKALDEIDLRVDDRRNGRADWRIGFREVHAVAAYRGLYRIRPAPSHITILGRPIQQNGRIVREVRRIRRDIGFVFQQFNLVNRLSVEQCAARRVVAAAVVAASYWPLSGVEQRFDGGAQCNRHRRPHATSAPARSPAVSSSAPRWRVRWCSARASSSPTNRSHRSIPSRRAV